MTAPFAPPPSQLQVIFTVGLIAFAIAMPFVRREDGIGWIAFLASAAFAVGLWVMLLWGMARAILRWWHGERDLR
jgi:hypothetical protein